MGQQVEAGILPKDFNYLLQEKLEIESAVEPSDIIWENRYFSDNERRKRSLIVFVVILLMLMVSGSIIFKISTKQKQLTFMYPQTTCKSQKAEYVSETSHQTLEDWQKDAIREFNVNEQYKKEH